MRKKTNRILSLLLALVVALNCVTFVAADTEAFAYTGDTVTFINAEGGAFGMFAPQEGTTCVINGDNVVIHYVPKNKTTYNALHWGAITDTLTADVAFATDGTFDITLPKTSCGKALPVAPIKASDATATTGTQYYLAIPAADKLTDVTPLAPLTYTGDTVTFIKEDGSGFGMFAPQEGTTCVINGDNVVIHYVPKNKTTYNALHWGAITDTLTADVAFATDGTFDITLPKTSCGKALPVAPIKASDAAATTKDQYYLAIPAADKLTDVTPEPPAPPVALAITNNTGMFKALTAQLETEGGNTTLVMSLSGSGYHELFKGTYEQAVANGAATDNWIHGATNADGKWEFRIPLAEGETYVPVVAISNSYYTKYLNGQNSLARAFFPRQFTIDYEAKTIVTGDYAYTQPLTVTNKVKMFKVSAAALNTVGGPNSNNYAATLALTMGSTSFDKAFVGRASAITDTTETIALGEGNTFALPVKWVKEFGNPDTLESLLGGSFVVSFHSVSKDAWYERQFTVSEADGKLTIDEVLPEAVTVEPGTRTLETGVCYRFGEGTFTLSGDPTVYQGGQEFYVSATGTYTVTKGR